MKSKAKSKTIILLTIGILFALSPIINNNLSYITDNSNKSLDYNDDRDNLKISAISRKIHIDGNSGWVDFRNDGNCTGNGTYSEPYVIEDLIIDANNSGSCILIENSNVCFKIENCTLYNSGGGYSNAGIKLNNITRGKLVINNCTANNYGIYLDNDSDNNTISGNTVNDNDYGIFLDIDSDNNTITGNTANNNNHWGMYLALCYHNIISGNTANNNSRGIFLAVSAYNIISGNTANNNSFCGIEIYHSDFNTVSGNTINDNINGIYLDNSRYNTVSGNTLIGNNECIVEENCQGNTFSDNGDCTYGQGNGGGIPIELIILISVISGGALIGVATILLIRRKRKRVE